MGSGDLGAEARRFVDWLAKAGQSWWQMLPVTPADADGSPYSGDSAFAGEPMLIALEPLVERGWLTREELASGAVKGSGSAGRSRSGGSRSRGSRPGGSDSGGRVRHRAVARHRRRLLKRAFKRARGEVAADLDAFAERESAWAPDYALYAALRRSEKHPWWLWPDALRRRRVRALAEARSGLGEAVAFELFLQWQFDAQWRSLRSYAAARGVGLLGDIPIFIGHDSADVWANPKLFDLDAKGLPREVSGAAPDAFSKDGQLWEHPLYTWSAHKRTGYAWWIARLRRVLSLFDAARVDPFLGFVRYWATPYGDRTAKRGRWRRGPGEAFFDAVLAEMGELPLIPEDLGILTPRAAALRDRYDLPGMRVVQFGFDAPNAYHAPHMAPRQSVIYTATHDCDTITGWFRAATRREQRLALDYTAGQRRGVNWDLIRATWSSPATLAVTQAQDVLGLGSEARMNRPGTRKGNWAWRLKPGQLTAAHARRLATLTYTFGRVPADG